MDEQQHDQGKVLFVVEKSDHDQVRVRETEFKGKKYIDIRIFSKNQVGEYVPTKKGLTLNPDKMKELKEGLDQVL